MSLAHDMGAGVSPVPFTYDTDVNPYQIQDIRDHVRSAMDRPWLSIDQASERPVHAQSIALVGGGPSLSRHIDLLRAFDGPILCVNHTVDYLVDNGIVPWGCVFGEVRSWRPSFLERLHSEVWYLPASQCHPDTLDMLADHPRVMLWHCLQQCGERLILRERMPRAILVSGGNSVLTRAINIAYLMGFRDFHLWGCDSSFDEQTHVYHDRPEGEIGILAAGKKFRTSYRLAMQADHLRWYTRTFAPLLGFKCYADGLFPHIHRTMFPSIYEETT